mgnify:CR=1 FL=1
MDLRTSQLDHLVSMRIFDPTLQAVLLALPHGTAIPTRTEDELLSIGPWHHPIRNLSALALTRHPFPSLSTTYL